MSKALLAVSFGTSHMDTMDKTVFAVEKAVSEAFPDRRFYRAFTSGIIIRKLKNEGILEVDTVEEAFLRMLKDGVDDVLIQPSLIINGAEMELLKKIMWKYKDRFARISSGNALLTEIEDYRELAAALTDMLPGKKPGKAYVFMGHGTEHYSNSAYAQLAYMFYDMGRTDIIVGTVEGYPGLNEVLRRLGELSTEKDCVEEALSVECYPLLIVVGDHAKNDLGGDDPGSWKSQMEQKGYNVRCHLKGLGEYKSIQDIFVKHAQTALETMEPGTETSST